MTADIAHEMQEALLLLSPALQQGHCTTTFEPAKAYIELYGLPGRLVQVVTNLVTNAIDVYAEQGGADSFAVIDRRIRE